MHKCTLLFMVAVLLGCQSDTNDNSQSHQEMQKPLEYALVIHGGAGTITKAQMTDDLEASYVARLNEAMDIGQGILQNGGTSLDAIQQTIMHLENSPLFNAGKGAVFTAAGTNELDASIMDGATQNAGAIGGVKNIKNPIVAARAVMEKSDHVMLTGTGAEQFAQEQGIETTDQQYFFTQKRWDALQRIKAADVTTEQMAESDKHGTVGAVALDKHGNLAAGTSTGGMTNKKYNRIGDSPIIGAGSYADNATCAVSSTGHGEYFIRYAVAYDIAARMAYKGISLSQAADEVVMQKLVEKGGSGGVIAVDKYGNVAMPFNSEGMYRGYVTPAERVVKIYKD